jgi:eukaryotic-like serine/threonine-protein kinase
VSAQLEQLSQALADRYRVVRELGQGGMATVYLADDLKHRRQVAIKVLRPELAAVIGAERFVREIQTIAALQHPHILGLIDSGEVSGTAYYVMPFVEGESLRDRLTREQQLSVPEAVRIATEVASALDYAHRHGVIHRDIKPENILLHDGAALVADFGIALAVSSAGGGSRMTETGMSLGTPHYMSPEQAMGQREITGRSDIYALGCVTYEMLIGEPPFTGPTVQAIVAKVMTAEPAGLTGQRRSVPPAVEGAVLMALEKLPADRFPTAADFAEALAGRSNQYALQAGAARETRSAGLSWRRRFQLASVALILATALGAWGWFRASRAARLPIDRRYLTLGDSVIFQQNLGQALALSPDGSLLAFLGDSSGRIWIKRRDQLNPEAYAGTEGARNLAFSSDGQWLAYIAGGSLRKLRIGGGSSVAIADSAGTGFGGVAWLDDNTVVYSSATLLGLRRVSANGGPVEDVLPDSVFQGLGIGNPTALPDSRGVIFQACNSGCVTLSLYAMDFRTGRRKLLFNDVNKGWALPSGDLLWVRQDGVALVAPFDLDQLEVRGAGVPVLQAVWSTLNQPQLAFSRSGSLVYAAGGVGSDVTLMRVGRDGAAQLVDPSWSGQLNSLTLSPDGRRLAVSATTVGAGLNIWIKQLDQGPLTRLTFSGRDRRPAWSPDGRLVAFVRDSGSGGDVYARTVDGSSVERRLAHLDRAIQEVAWFPDGRRILVRTDNSALGSADILAVPVTGDSAPVAIAASSYSELHPAVSPDGRWVAYSSNEAGLSEVYVRPFPHTDAGRWQVSARGGSSPVWSADGKDLFFLDPAQRVTAASIVPGPNFGVRGLQRLFDASVFSMNPFHQGFVTTRDGHFLFLGSTQSTRSAVRLVQVDNWFADLRARLGQ